MAFQLPTTLSPSKVSSFKDCALAFRFSAIDQLPEEPSIAATRGTLVHLALEHLFDREPQDRGIAEAIADLGRALEELREDPDFSGLELDEEAEATFVAEADRLVRRYFEIEDPSQVHPVGLELKLEARVDDIRIRGIIDRLELNADGGLVVTDYKTGKSPHTSHQQGRLGGVTFYALLCQELFGVLPAQVQLIYLGDGLTITTEPTEQAIRALKAKLRALWQAISLACEKEDFRPRPGPLCNWCSFRAYCPAQGGDLSLVDAYVAERTAAAS
ncbi:RecB family exonuclease [Aquihabitans sp. McL0605]|uniref:RecB family exonuclease n=1 Tax=Aquihabitans sp. McL0605 TaxID=3415671 RepID=UPI003CF2DB3A